MLLLRALLPGPKTGCLKILGEKFSQNEQKNSAYYQKYVFTAMNDKISIKMSCLEILSQKKVR
jgi:hypothetical protein